MQPLVHTRSVEWYYPASRDAKGQPLGIVQPGDVREFEEPPDRSWEPATDELVARMRAVRDAQAALEAPADAGQGSSGPTGTPAAARPASTPPGTPAPPAARPASPATQTTDAGAAGSEEG